MKKYILIALALTAAFSASAQTISVLKQNGYKLVFFNQDKTLDTALQTRMINTFFKVYPELATEYNPRTLKEVMITIDTAYKGVAETEKGNVKISSAWMHKHPEDIDVITHEVTHIVQDYGDSVGPGWLTEGIADYARYKFGVNNYAAKWSLTPYKAGQNYDNAYRITARFLLWIEEKVKPGMVRTLDFQLRTHSYTNNSWQQLTGKMVDELWKAYTEKPEL